jgi:phenylacetic acid degradation protein
MKWKVEGTAQYHALAVRSLATLREVQPLAQPEPNRGRYRMEDVVPLIVRKREA